MKTKTLTAVALIAAAIPVLGLAQSELMRPQAPQLDFATADADASGGISLEEWTTYVSAQAETRRAEMLGLRADRLIGAGDANSDGQLTRDELIAGMDALGDERRERVADRRSEYGARGQGMYGYGHRGDDHGHGVRGHGHDDDHGHGGRGHHHDDDHGYGSRGHHGDDHHDHGHGMRGYGSGEGRGYGMRGDADHGYMEGFGRRGMIGRFMGMDPADRAEHSFERIDGNGDGQIDADELADVQAHIAERFERRNNN